MSSIIKSWKLEESCWNENSQLKAVALFNDLWRKDKSHGKKDSSNIMWGISLYADPDSIFYDIYEEERKKLISKDWFKEDNFNWDNYTEYINYWEKFKTPAEKQKDSWNKFMGQKTEYMSTLNYAENGDEIEKRLLSDEKLYEALEKINARMSNKGGEGTMKGQATESLSEQGII